MIPELGNFSLVLALSLAVLLSVVPMIGVQKNNELLMALSRPLCTGVWVFMVISFGCLAYAFLNDDFSVAYVASNSNSLLPVYYKLTAVWGGHEGSLLLWVLMVASWTYAVSLFSRNLPLDILARVLAVMGIISVSFLLFMLFTSNPFDRLLLNTPADGTDLNPLLQDFGIIVHPPFLYMGYVGFSVAFAFAITALLSGKMDAAWARWTKPWTNAAWAFLTIGIALGSWWAYYELGWGGWWFWDPVENASFMPWLAGTALLHSAIVSEKRDTLKSWTIFLAIIAFAFSLLGTFLVRSGVLTSVHAFASDPDRGVFILAILVISIGTAFALYAWRGPSLKGTGLFQPVSREGGLLLNNFLLTVAAFSVLLGTLYPLFVDVLELGKVSVGAPYFNSVFVPMMIPMILVMGVAPFLSWKRGDGTGALNRLKIAGAIAVLGGIGVWLAIDRASIFAAFGIALAIWLFAATLTELAGRIHLFKVPVSESWRRLMRQPRASWGMTLAHAGIALGVAGMTASSAWQVEKVQAMKPGQSVEVSGYTFTLIDAREVPGPNYQALRGTFEVKSGSSILRLQPEKRVYTVSRQPTTEAAIHPTFLGDIYAVIGDPDGQGGYVTRLYFNPLVPWMWVGAMIMVLGAGISLSDRRHRVGAPSQRKATGQTPQGVVAGE